MYRLSQWLNDKESDCNAEDMELEDSPGGGNGYTLQYSCLGNHMDRGAWWTMGLQKSRTDLVTKRIYIWSVCVCVTVCIYVYTQNYWMWDLINCILKNTFRIWFWAKIILCVTFQTWLIDITSLSGRSQGTKLSSHTRPEVPLVHYGLWKEFQSSTHSATSH